MYRYFIPAKKNADIKGSLAVYDRRGHQAVFVSPASFKRNSENDFQIGAIRFSKNAIKEELRYRK